jgi:hypothetical protein
MDFLEAAAYGREAAESSAKGPGFVRIRYQKKCCERYGHERLAETGSRGGRHPGDEECDHCYNGAAHAGHLQRNAAFRSAFVRTPLHNPGDDAPSSPWRASTSASSPNAFAVAAATALAVSAATGTRRCVRPL